MKNIFFFLFLINLYTVNSSALDRFVGNGGIGIECQNTLGNKDIQLLDYFDGDIFRSHLWDEFFYQEDLDVSFQVLIERLMVLDPTRARLIELEYKNFFSNTLFIDDVILSDTNDALNLAIPINCKTIQLAIQRAPRFPNEKRYNINSIYFNRLDSINKFGLVLHEILYKEAIGYGAFDSRSVRFLTSFLTSKDLLTVSKVNYKDILSSTDFTYEEIGLINLNFLDAKKWTAVTDQSERGGKSDILVINSDDRSSLTFLANLVPIEARRTKTLVGFAGAELILSSPLIYTSGSSFNLELETLRDFVLSLTVIDSAGVRFQYDLEVESGSNSYKINLQDFRKTYRGRATNEPPQNGTTLNSVSLSVLYSRQKVESGSYSANWILKDLSID